MPSAIEPYPVSAKYGRWFIIIGLLTLAAFGLRTISHSDFWMTLACGRWIAGHGIPHTDPFSLTRANAPWMDPTWLYDWLVFRLWSAGGAPLVTLTHIAAVVAAFLLLLRVARPFGGPMAMTVALLVSAWLLGPAFAARGRVLTLVFPALFMVCLFTGAGRWWPWLVLLPAQVLWTNMYHTFRLGPVICLIFAVQQFWQWRRAHRGEIAADTTPSLWEWLNPLLLTFGTLAATLVNPYGWELYRTVAAIGFGSAGLLAAEEISPFSALFGATDTKRLIWMAATINLMGLVAEKQRLPLGITLLAILGTGLAIASPHHAPVMAVLSFPFFTLSARAAGLFLWDAFSDVLQRRAALVDRLVMGVIILGCVITISRLVSNHYYYASGSASAFGLGVNDELMPSTVVPVLARSNFPAIMLNDPLDGGYLLWRLPNRPVFIDARMSFYGHALTQLAVRSLAGDPQAWQILDQRLAPGAVLFNCCHPSAALGLRNVLATRHWVLAYFDGTSALLLRNTPENKALLQDPQLQSLGLTSLEMVRRAYLRRAEHHWFPTHSPALIGAGNVLMVLKQYADAEKIYAELVRGAPHLASAWLELGVCQFHQGRWTDALTSLRHATAAAPRDVLGWLWYGETCQQLGLTEEAKAAFQRAHKLNSAVATAFAQEVHPPPAPQPAPRAAPLK